MSVQAWTVDVDGIERNVSIHPDPQTGKTSIRVDGKMAARPLTHDEIEREVIIGRGRYVVRRAEGGFELDILAAEPLYVPAPSMPVAPAVATKTTSPLLIVAMIFAGIFALVFLIGVGNYVRNVLPYSRVPWQSYTPPGGKFSVDLPEKPDEQSETKYVQGNAVTVTSLRSKYRNHYYYLEFAQMPFVVTPNREKILIDSAADFYVKNKNATIVTREDVTIAGHNGLRFTATIPKNGTDPAGALRSQVVVRSGVVYSMVIVKPLTDKIEADTDHYFASLKFPE